MEMTPLDQQIPAAAPMTPLGARTPLAHPALPKIIAGLAVILLAGVWLVWADVTGHWPYKSAMAAVQYRNAQYGLQVDLPRDWEGFTVITGTREMHDISSSDLIGTAPTITIRNPNWTAANHYEDLPIDVYTPSQWHGIVAENISVSAAPIPPSFLASNSDFVFALPARYNYDFATGYQELQNVLNNGAVKAFGPTGATSSCVPRPACLDATPRCLPPEPIGGWCPTPTPSASTTPNATAGWKTYASALYGYRFSYPSSGFSITTPPPPTSSNWPVECGDIPLGVCTVMSEQYRDANYGGTNLAGAGFAVKILDQAGYNFTTEATCDTYAGYYGSPKSSEHLTDTVTINGVIFYKATAPGGAAAGTDIGGTFYRTFHGGKCWELYTGNAFTGTGPDFAGAKAFTAAQTQTFNDLFSGMLNSFAFTK